MQRASTRQITGPSASCVQKTRTPCLEVVTSLTVRATLAGQERTLTAQDVCQANSNPVKELTHAPIALRGHIPALLQRAVWIAQQASTRQITGLTASGVLQTPTLCLRVATSRTVRATLAGLERMAIVAAVCLANTKPAMGLTHARIVDLENIQLP